MPTASRRQLDLVDVLAHLQLRDRVLLRLLADHLVLTTTQISSALFSSLRMCQHRLRQLHHLELLDQFSRPRSRHHGGSPPAHWTLGRLGLDLHAAAHEGSFTSTRTARQRLAQLAESPTLDHLLGTNEFFTDLLAHARTHRHTRLVRWWSEREATRRFTGVQPDGHGLWRHGEHLVGFFLEYDRSTEDLPRVIKKLAGYERLARSGGPAYPVLFSLRSADREAHLHQALAGVASRCPVATATRQPGTPGPGAAVWALVGADPSVRIHLHDLDSDHGGDNPRNPNWRGGRLALDDQPP